MKTLKAAAIALLLAALPLCASAQNKKDLNPWIDCGIGAMVFDNGPSWAAVISNIIWDLGTTAVISNVSSQDGCKSAKAKTALYIGTTYANLSEETVKGDGKHLHAMLEIAGCNPSAHDGVIGSLRSEYAQYMSDAGTAAKSKAIQAQDFYGFVQKATQGACSV